jgi:hypothetical protein
MGGHSLWPWDWAELKLRPYEWGDLGWEKRIKEWLERLRKGKTDREADL